MEISFPHLPSPSRRPEALTFLCRGGVCSPGNPALCMLGPGWKVSSPVVESVSVGASGRTPGKPQILPTRASTSSTPSRSSHYSWAPVQFLNEQTRKPRSQEGRGLATLIKPFIWLGRGWRLPVFRLACFGQWCGRSVLLCKSRVSRGPGTGRGSDRTCGGRGSWACSLGAEWSLRRWTARAAGQLRLVSFCRTLSLRRCPVPCPCGLWPSVCLSWYAPCMCLQQDGSFNAWAESPGAGELPKALDSSYGQEVGFDGGSEVPALNPGHSCYSGGVRQGMRAGATLGG